MTSRTDDFEVRCINTIRVLTADMVEKANSGHPGAPMGLAPVAHVLWTKILSYNPANPSWLNRDRFVLSNGHACALLYAMMHLAGFKDMTMEQLQKFRQIGGITPGHPENWMLKGVSCGVEVSTGPLGQGISNAVGMAIAEENLRHKYKLDDGEGLINHFVFVICGDGCLQEGISSEACSLAGHLGLGRLILIYDDNKITIDGDTAKSFSEDVLVRFDAYGWHTQSVADGNHNTHDIEEAIQKAKKVTDRPSIIKVWENNQ